MVGKVEGHELGWSHVVLFSVNADQKMLRDFKYTFTSSITVPSEPSAGPLDPGQSYW